MESSPICKICEALNQVNTAITRCKLCRTDIDTIAALGEREFVLDWLPFHWCKSECVKLIALTMEPSNPGVRQKPTPVPSASRPLKYALRRLLVQPTDGFLITPTAKCSLRTANARETQEVRWMLCSRFLREEIDALRGAGLLCPGFGIIAIGDHPDGFLCKAPSMRELSPMRLGKLTHYGALNYGGFRLADTDQKAFARFLEEHEHDYRAFVSEHVCWDRERLDRELKGDMQILFKWDRQMAPWRERLQ